jgi:hypothetical protein
MAGGDSLYQLFQQAAKLSRKRAQAMLVVVAQTRPTLARRVQDLLDADRKSLFQPVKQPSRRRLRRKPRGDSRGRWFWIFGGFDLVAVGWYLFFFVTLFRYVLPHLDERGLQRIAFCVLVSFAFSSCAAFLAYRQPGEVRVRFAYGALMSEALCLLSFLLRPAQFSGWTRPAFLLLMTFDGLNLPLAYHFYWSFFQNALGRAKGARWIKPLYGYAALIVLSRWIPAAALDGTSSAVLDGVDNLFYLIEPLVICAMILSNFRLLPRESRKGVSLFVLASIAGVLPYALGRLLRGAMDVTATPYASDSPAYFAVEMFIVLSIALIPIAAVHAILSANMFGIVIGQEGFAAGVWMVTAVFAITDVAFTFHRNWTRTLGDGLMQDPSFVRLALELIALWVLPWRPVSQWLNEHLNAAGASRLRQCPECKRVEGPAVRLCPNPKCGAPLESKPIPRTVGGKYRMDDFVGQGGMGLVYKARDLQLERWAAIKILHPDLLLRDPSLAERVYREAKAAARAKHPNIVTIYDVQNNDRGPVFIAMEFIFGTSLSDHIAENPLSVAEAAECFRQIFAAVQTAHEQNVIHRDLKPDNVMLSETRENKYHVTLLDFGIARLISSDGDTPLTRTGAFLGTPAYCAPELVALGEPDARSDIYALTVMLVEVLTGRFPPLQKKSPPESISAAARALCLQRAESLPLPLRSALSRGLAIDPCDRFQNVAEFRSAVLPHLTGNDQG